ncbi:MAG: ribosome small subunit-dependent GTPase A [Desulfitobacterium sp.]|nr:ribosome small subunit-dependent GTPase A [Desulfitobacterium sp.]
MLSGIILKGYSGFYYVYAEGQVWECSLRGRFRVRNQEFLPGDRVKILPGVGNKGTIEKVLPRENQLKRPTIANVDQAFLTFAILDPEPDLNLLDRLLIQVTAVNIKPVIILNKIDLVKGLETSDSSERFFPEDGLDFYQELGYKVIKFSSKTGEGIEELQEHINYKVSVLAGPSGVGKSSIVNTLDPDLEIKTGEVSRKLKRGRHTTRHVELLVCGEGLLADTPGFSSLRLPSMTRQDLSRYMVEFRQYGGECRFNDCLHLKEPDCGVKAALAEGKIRQSRYDHYCQFLEEVIASERRY